MKVTVMGLGLNGGGLEAARFLAGRGAICTITDMKDENALRPSIEELENSPGLKGKFRYVLGRHETEDFSGADMVIKNPGVRPDSPFIRAARRIETDISLFLDESPARLFAVTGSKGKSSAASALYQALRAARDAARALPAPLPGVAPLPGAAYLGGNITVSPLGFLDRLGKDDDVVLELSSWQLGDLRLCGENRAGCRLLKPRCAVITSLMKDHQDRYGNMESYLDDKREIYRNQDGGALTAASADDGYGESFLAQTPARPFPYSEKPLSGGRSGGWLTESGAGFVRLPGLPAPVQVLGEETAVAGFHQKKNLLAAGIALLDIGLPALFIRESLGAFRGIEHRLELFLESSRPGGRVRFYNDSAATIPEAAAAAVETLGSAGLVVITGGTDKNLDFAPLVRALAAARPLAVILLDGTGSAKLAPLLTGAGVAWQGPFDDLDRAVTAAIEAAEKAGGDVSVALSPGCASFGMFKNEFDRGRRFKEAAARLTNGG